MQSHTQDWHLLSATIFDIPGPEAMCSLVPRASVTVHQSVPAQLFA